MLGYFIVKEGVEICCASFWQNESNKLTTAPLIFLLNLKNNKTNSPTQPRKVSSQTLFEIFYLVSKEKYWQPFPANFASLSSTCFLAIAPERLIGLCYFEKI